MKPIVQVIISGVAVTMLGAQPSGPAVTYFGASTPSVTSYYRQPDGVSRYLRPDGTSFYTRP